MINKLIDELENKIEENKNNDKEVEKRIKDLCRKIDEVLNNE